MRYFIGFFYSFALLVANLGQAFGVDIAVCGESEGYGYFPKFGAMSTNPESGKWREDKISNGSITVSVDENMHFDLIFSDTRGATSARKSGGEVLLIGYEDNFISFAVLYKGLHESYTFLRNAEGEAEVIWAQNRYSAIIPKISSFRASCSYMAF